jgi:hypothetical protein
MVYEAGEIKTFNPQKEVSYEIVLESLIRHRDAVKQARTGEKIGIDMNKITDDERRLNQVQALSLIISAQREMITISRPIVFFNSSKDWEKSYPKEESRLQHPFDKYKCHYNDLMEWLDFLKNCLRAIEQADISKTTEDDFLVQRTISTGERIKELTNNFWEMLEDLESSYEKIYLIMLINKIVSSGIEEDDDLTYKQKEEEAIRRVVEA